MLLNYFFRGQDKEGLSLLILRQLLELVQNVRFKLSLRKAGLYFKQTQHSEVGFSEKEETCLAKGEQP
jgi:hypothetical protein